MSDHTGEEYATGHPDDPALRQIQRDNGRQFPEPEVPADGIEPFAEEGAELSESDVPTRLLKNVEVTHGVLGNDLKVVVAVLTLVDSDAWKEEGLLLVMASEDGMKFAAALKSVSATISPSYRQAERAKAAQEENP